MSKTRIFSVVGARPQFVKAAIVSQALEKYPDVEHAIVHTGQHYDQNMSDVFFEELGMPAPAFNLHISASGHGAMTGRMLEALEKLYIDEKPDVVVVYGDTNSTLPVRWLRPRSTCRWPTSRPACARSTACRKKSTGC